MSIQLIQKYDADVHTIIRIGGSRLRLDGFLKDALKQAWGKRLMELHLGVGGNHEHRERDAEIVPSCLR